MIRVSPEDQYLEMLEDLLTRGVYREGRNGGTFSLFGRQIRFDLSRGSFPLLTTKKMAFKSVIVELLWFLRGDTNIKYLHDHGVTIWDEWADENGDLGPVYGRQWRRWRTPERARLGEGGIIRSPGRDIDQIADTLGRLKSDPYSRRHVVSAWNPADVDDMALPPCHCLFQFYVAPDIHGVQRLSLQLYQRSADVFLGVPFNIASYAALIQIVAREIGAQPGEFIHTFGDFHLYGNHVAQARAQLTRKPKAFPKLVIAPVKGGLLLDRYQPQHFTLEGYDPHPAIPAPVSK